MSLALEEAIQQAVKPGADRLLPGVALAAASSREDVPDYVACYGTLQIAPSPAVTTETIFWTASCAKLATSIAALQCVERGLFSLDSTADIERLLPEWASPDVLTFHEDGSITSAPAKERITLRRLLTHTSGLGYDILPPLAQWRQSRGEESQFFRGTVAESCVHPLIFEPGSDWNYGSGLDVAGLMVGRANNCSLEAYMRRNIFNVLDMQSASFHVSHNDMRERLMPVALRPSPEEPLTDIGEDSALPKQPVDAKDDYGGAGLFSTAPDYLKLLKSVLRNDGKLLTSKSVDLLFEPSLTPQTKAGLHAKLSIPDLAKFMIPGEPIVGTPDSGDWDHSLGGLIGLHESNDGFQSPWVQWVGGPNLKWWIDQKGGTCGIFATQLFPLGEANHTHLQKLFQREMVKKFNP